MSIKDDEIKKEELRSAIAKLPEDVIRDALVLSLANTGNTVQNAEQKNLDTEGFADIFELISYIKRTYTFPELDHLLIEGGKLLFKDGDRRIVISEKKQQQIKTGNQAIGDLNTSISKPKPVEPGSVSEAERFNRLEFDD